MQEKCVASDLPSTDEVHLTELDGIKEHTRPYIT